ncbi:MAG: hypothetical protein ACRD12_06685 [Acidimicrobiales bacterium]
MNGPGFARWWARCYTRGLPPDLALARRDEIASDVYEHQAGSAGRGTGAAVVGRTLRGVADDLLWRRAEKRGTAMSNGALTGLRAAWAAVTQAWFAPVAVLVGLFNVTAAVAVLADGNGKMPGRVIGPIVMLALAAGIFAGLWMRWRATQPARPAAAARSTAVPRVAIGLLAAVAIAAVITGAMTSFYLLAIGVLTLAGAGMLASRRRTGRRPNAVLADVLIVVGTLPALGLWWLIFPAVMALVVIAGVVGTAPGTRRAAAATS